LSLTTADSPSPRGQAAACCRAPCPACSSFRGWQRAAVVHRRAFAGPFRPGQTAVWALRCELRCACVIASAPLAPLPAPWQSCDAGQAPLSRTVTARAIPASHALATAEGAPGRDTSGTYGARPAFRAVACSLRRRVVSTPSPPHPPTRTCPPVRAASPRRSEQGPDAEMGRAAGRCRRAAATPASASAPCGPRTTRRPTRRC